MSRVIAFLMRIAYARGNAFAFFQTLVTQALVLGMNIATGVITARLLGPEGRGIFTAATLWPQFLGATGLVGLPYAVVYYMRNESQDSGSILTAGLILGGALSLLAAAIGFAAVPLSMTNFPRSATLLAELCVLAAIPYAFTNLLRQVFVAQGLFSAFNLSSYLPPALFLLSLLVVWGAVGLTPTLSAVCLVATAPIVLFWMGGRLVRRCRPRAHRLREWLLILASYSARAASIDLLAGIGGYSDRLALIYLVSPEELGLYAVAYSLTRLLLVQQIAITAVIYPSMAGRSQREIKTLHDHVFRFVAYAGAGAVVLFFLLGHRLLLLAYGPAFADADLLVDILVVEAAISCLAHAAMQLFLSLDRPGYVSTTHFVWFVAVVVGLILLVPHYGSAGAATAMLVAAVSRLTALLFGIKAQLRLGLPRLHPIRSDLVYLRSQLAG